MLAVSRTGDWDGWEAWYDFPLKELREAEKVQCCSNSKLDKSAFCLWHNGEEPLGAKSGLCVSVVSSAQLWCGSFFVDTSIRNVMVEWLCSLERKCLYRSLYIFCASPKSKAFVFCIVEINCACEPWMHLAFKASLSLHIVNMLTWPMYSMWLLPLLIWFSVALLWCPHSDHSDCWHQQGIFLNRSRLSLFLLGLYVCVLSCWVVFLKPKRWLCLKNPCRGAVWKMIRHDQSAMMLA